MEHLQLERSRFIAHPHVPEDLDVSQRVRYVADEVAAFDARIAQVFEEQTRILVMFQLLINIGAEALQKKNRARVKDFLRKYFARKLEIQAAKAQGLEVPKRRRTAAAFVTGGSGISANAVSNAGSSDLVAEDDDESDDDTLDDYPLIDLQSANAVEIQEWAQNNTELRKRAMQYIVEQQASVQSGKKKQEEQRIAAAERKKAATVSDAAAAVRSGAMVPMTPRSGTHVPDFEEKKSSSSPTVAVMPNVSGGGGYGSTGASDLHPGSGLGKQLGGVDAFQYRQRNVSFAVDELNIRGPTAESVVAQARQAVGSIIRRHEAAALANRSGSGNNKPDEALLFSDPFFPPVGDLDSLIDAGTDPSEADKKTVIAGSGSKKKKACWKRPRDIAPNPQVFPPGNSLDPALIIQGDLEDCYLLSALSVIAKNPERIKNLFLVSEYNEYGIYGMCFFVDGEWRAVFVDDQFPYTNNQLAFARSKNKNEFWLPILEKCYAKLYGQSHSPCAHACTSPSFELPPFLPPHPALSQQAHFRSSFRVFSLALLFFLFVARDLFGCVLVSFQLATLRSSVGWCT